jgi:integrase
MADDSREGANLYEALAREGGQAEAAEIMRTLIDNLVARLRPPATGRLEVWDSTLPAFGLRVTATGARTWIVAARRPGKRHPVRLKIGTPDQPELMSLADARDKARTMMDRGAPEAPVKLRELAEQFLEHGRRKRGAPLREATLKEYRRALMTYAVPLHERSVREVRRREIAELVVTIARERGATTAQRARAALQRFWGWMLARDLVEANVVAGVEGYATGNRQRVLSDVELVEVWGATQDTGDYGRIVRLLLWTGCRRGEAGGMAWSELDSDLWTVPGERTKNHRPLVLPLPRQAVDALTAWPRVIGQPHLFGRGASGFGGWSQAKRRLDQRIAGARAERRLGRRLQKREKPVAADYMQAWTLHDLRRTVETRMAGLGIPKDHVNRVLNHAAGPITEAYDLHSYIPEKRAALQKWADQLELLTNIPSGQLVEIKRYTEVTA